MSGAEPLGDGDFATLMAGFEPFETRPRLAVAVSGGADSLALALLAGRWAGRIGGRVDALIVDHKLRAASVTEAEDVRRQLTAWGQFCHILSWTDGKPNGGVQAAARAARYRLMTGWCRDAGVLHLLVGHHAADQAETVAMRLLRGSGPRGLAGMRREVATSECRILRPFLSIEPERLRATLAAASEPWVEDPSNADETFTRVRLRALMPSLAAAGAGRDVLAMTATRAADVADAFDVVVTAAIARVVTPHPVGCVWIDRHAFLELPPVIARQVLSRVLASVGGRRSEPPAASVEAMLGRQREDDDRGGWTLARCRVLQSQARLLVCRETRGLPPPMVPPVHKQMSWDHRFRLQVWGDAAAEMRVQPLGADGWREIKDRRPDLLSRRLPRAAGITLPALVDARGVLDVPQLGYRRDGGTATAGCRLVALFRPARSLAGTGYCLA